MVWKPTTNNVANTENHVWKWIFWGQTRQCKRRPNNSSLRMPHRTKQALYIDNERLWKLQTQYQLYIETNTPPTESLISMVSQMRTTTDTTTATAKTTTTTTTTYQHLHYYYYIISLIIVQIKYFSCEFIDDIKLWTVAWHWKSDTALRMTTRERTPTEFDKTAGVLLEDLKLSRPLGSPHGLS